MGKDFTFCNEFGFCVLLKSEEEKGNVFNKIKNKNKIFHCRQCNKVLLCRREKFRSAVWFSYNKMKTERDGESSSILVVLMTMITGHSQNS